MKLPEPFVAQMQSLLGADYQAFAEALENETPVSIRLNPRKNTKQSPDNNEKVAWCAEGFYLPSRPVFTLDPAFHAGTYYVQEASSMFVAEAVRQTVDLSKPLRVMDLCAAPGGKSTLLASLINDKSMLVANEVIKNRVGVLKENLEKWGFPNYIVANQDVEEMIELEGFFDVVLVDAPCSGEGLFRKDPKAMNEWSPDSVIMCSARQKRILQAAAMLVKSGGVLLYSTCTYNEKENQENTKWLTQLFDFQQVSLNIPNEWNVTEKDGGYQFFPHKVKGEGFFLSVFKKASGWNPDIRGKIKLQKLHRKKAEVLVNWLEKPENFEFYEKEDKTVVAVPASLSIEYAVVLRSLQKRSSGLELGQFKGDDFIPSHALALSTIIKQDLPSVELSKEDALRFLKKENLSVEIELNGWLLVRYEGRSLGWMKSVSGRINNYLPKEWRIRMEIE